VLHLKLVNGSDTAEPLTLDIPNAKSGAATLYTMHGGSRWATNTIEHPDAVKPTKSTVQLKATNAHSVPGNTIEVLDIPLK
jgi:alpha-N-arabinofuranosidase